MSAKTISLPKDLHASSVELTNNSSSVSKRSACSLGYFHDPYISLFVPKSKRRSPLINRGYYIRMKTINERITKWIQLYATESQMQIISLGAGFDSTYLRLKENGLLPESCTFIELDLPSVVHIKRSILQVASPELLVSGKYHLVEQDITNIKLLQATLVHIGVNFDSPTLFFAECVASYLDRSDYDNIMKFIGSSFSRGSLIIYEQCIPELRNNAFCRVMTTHFKKLNSPLKTLCEYEKLRQRFLSFGFQTCFLKRMDHVWFEINKTEKKRLLEIEPFDEHEEWLAKLSHYFILECRPASECEGETSLNSVVRTYSSVKCEVKLSPVERYAHCSVALDNEIFSFGGFSSCEGSHAITSLMVRYNLMDGDYSVTDVPFTARMHATCVSIGDAIIIQGGRASPKKVITEDIILLKDLTILKTKGICRYRHTATVLTDSIYVIGGRDGSKTFSSVTVYSYQNNVLTQQDEFNLQIARHSHSACVFENKIIISGGLSATEEVLNSIEIIDIESKTVRLYNMENLRFGHQSTVLDHGFLVIVGGMPAHSDIMAIELSSCTNESAAGTAAVYADLALGANDCMLMGHTMVVSNGRAYIVGGGGNCFSFGTHFNSIFVEVCLEQLQHLGFQSKKSVLT